MSQLEHIGMVWDAFSEKWEQGFAAAAKYYADHGNLVVPVSYTTKDGLRFGESGLETRNKLMPTERCSLKRPNGLKALEFFGSKATSTSSGTRLTKQQIVF